MAVVAAVADLAGARNWHTSSVQHTYSPSTWEVETENDLSGSPSYTKNIQGQHGLT